MIFISGAISKCLDKADARFAKAERILKEAFPNEKIFNPCEYFAEMRGEWDERTFQNEALKKLAICSSMFRMIDAENDVFRSVGASLEMDLAEKLEIPVFNIYV